MLGAGHLLRSHFRGEGGLRFCDSSSKRNFFYGKFVTRGGLKSRFLHYVIGEPKIKLGHKNSI